MSKFKDSAGNTWKLRITMGTIKKVHEDTGLNLSKMLDDDMALAKDIMTDGLKTVAVLFSICEEQLNEANIDENQFAERLYGDPFVAAKDALWKAFLDFCPSQQREILQALEAKTNELQTQAREEIEREINLISFEKRMKTQASAG